MGRRSRPAFGRLAVAVVAALALGASPAWARGDDEPGAEVEAYRAAVQAGSAAFDAEDYAAAREAFERAHRIHAEPVLLFNIASTYRREGDYDAALRAYRRFLQTVPADHPRAPLARETVAHLELIVRERRDAEREAERLRAEARGSSARAARAAEAAAEPVPPLAAATGPGPARDDARRRRWSTLRWTGVAVAAVGAGGLGFAWVERNRAQSIADDVEALPPGTPWDPVYADRLADGEAAERRALAFAIGGGALVVTGAALAIWGGDDDDDDGGGGGEDRLVITPRAGRGELGVGLSGRF